MSVWLPRGAITTYLVNQLSNRFTFPVGDDAPPMDAHGWQGEPNADATNFIPWVTLAPGNAASTGGSIEQTQSEWRATYYISTAGVTRKQTEGVADIARGLLVNTARDTITSGTTSWRVLQVRVTSIGGVSRLTTISPAYFVQTDAVEIWLSKEI